MSIYITDTKRYICLFLALSLFFCAILGALMLLGFKTAPSANEPAFADEALPTVIIDAGHGGEDGGAIGFGDVYEKDLNLSIALMLSDILKLNGINTVLTRSEDILLYDKNSDYQGQKKVQDLATRRKIAESYENAIFVSIHMNAFPEEKYSGLQVYYSKNEPSSKALAENIQDITKELLLPENNRKCKEAGKNIYLLDRLECPAVLVECGFLSNKEECARLSEREYRQKLALCLASAVTKYVNDVKKTA